MHRTIRTTLLATLVALAATLGWASAAHATYKPAPEAVVRAAQRAHPPRHGTTAYRAWAVCVVWRTARPATTCRHVLNVAWCESSLRPWASNGQYLGTFQMGRRERATYGHDGTTWGQARAARRYHDDARVRGFGPWQCKPTPPRR